jgi:hypothetical protein
LKNALCVPSDRDEEDRRRADGWEGLFGGATAPSPAMVDDLYYQK